MTWQEEDSEPRLTERLVDAYRRAAGSRTTSLQELAELLGVDVPAAREIADGWERIGLAVADRDGFRLRAPDSAVAQLIGGMSTRMRRELEALGRLVASGAALSSAWRESFEHDAVDYTIDRIHDDGAAWFAWWSYLLEREGGEAVAIVSNLDALATMDSAAPGLLGRTLDMLERGEVALSLLVPPEARAEPAAVLMDRLADAGAAIRVGDASDWFAAASGEVALVPATWGRDRDVSALLVREPSIVAGLESLFRLRWHAASPWRGPAAAQDPVIEALCEGRTDGDIADRFGISVRSVRRRVAAAIAETGSASRMELGYRLGSGARPDADRSGGGHRVLPPGFGTLSSR